MSVHKIKKGRPTYLNPDEEALVVVSDEMEGAHGLPIDVNTLGAELQLVIRVVNARQCGSALEPSALLFQALSSHRCSRIAWIQPPMLLHLDLGKSVFLF